MNRGSIVSIGIDQGIANCGYAVVELTEDDKINVLSFGTIKTPSSQTFGKRLTTIYEKITTIIGENDVNIMGCEKLFFNPQYKATNRNKSASMMHTNMATGVLHLISEKSNVGLKDFVPGTVKKLVAGHGRASKEDVEEAVKSIIGNPEEIRTEHEADAIAIGITAVKFLKENPDCFEKKKKVKKKKTKKKEKEIKNKKEKGDKNNEK